MNTLREHNNEDKKRRDYENKIKIEEFIIEDLDKT